MIKEYDREMVKEVMDIWLSTTVKAHDFIPESYWARNFITVKTQYLPNSDTFVCERDGKICGFISIMNSGTVGALFVSSDFQGKGIGKALLDHAKEYYDQLNLKVYVKNQKAFHFYESQGFSVDEEQMDQETGEQEYTMSWTTDEWVDMMMSIQC